MDLIVDSDQHIILTFVAVVQPPFTETITAQRSPLRSNKMMQNKRDCPTNFSC